MRLKARIVRCAVFLVSLPLGLRAQPGVPSAEQQQAQQLRANVDTILPAPAALSVDISTRQESRAFYNAIYNLPESAQIDWTGTLSGTPGTSVTGTPGTTADSYKAAVQLRINWFRAMAGVPASVGMDLDESAMDQQAALMMTANNALSHTPPASWLLYTADGATAAANSNLALGNVGPDAISLGYIMDSGSNNSAAGHRRWILYPQTQTMATGDIPMVGSFYSANATWIMDANYGGPRPAVRDNFVAWPPPGYVPYQVVFPRWSFSYPNADFSAATVTMTSGGQPVPATLETVAVGEGENTLVWDFDNLDGATDTASLPQPSSDTAYNVQINNVLIGGQSTNFSYTVTIFDPAVVGSGEAATTVSGPSTVTVGQSASYSVSGVPAFASGFEYRSLALSSFSTVFSANGGLQGVIAAVSSSYNPVDTSVVASGSYHLAMPDFTTQTLTLPGEYLFATGSAMLNFQSMLGYSGPGQTALVQLSLDDGTTWNTLYSQTGSGGAGETSFTGQSLSLAAYAGHTFMIRFAYVYTEGEEAFTQTSAGVGWYLDNITLTGVESAAVGAASALQTGAGFSAVPATAGALGIQATPVLFGLYPLPYGPVLFETAAAQSADAPSFTTQPASATIAAGGTVAFSAAASGSPAPTYQWYLDGRALSDGSGSGVEIIGSQASTLVIQGATNAQAGTLSCVASNANGQSTSNAATLNVTTTDNPGRLINLSVLSLAGSGPQLLTVGFVSGGANTTGTQSLLLRATGPALTGFGVTGVMPDPELQLFNSSSAVIATNIGWASTPSNETAVTAADTATGAFTLTNPASADSAMVQTLNGGRYSVEVSSVSGTSGQVLAEIYDDTPGGAYTLATPRLVNLSCSVQVKAGGTLTGGFVIGGNSSETVLIRASGPALSAFGVSNVMPDPQIVVYKGQQAIASNAGWGGNPAVTAEANAVYAFAYTDPTSKDSAVLLTLPPGSYSAAASSVSGSGGDVLIEVYEVP